MIKKRIAARARRLELQRNLIDVVNDIQGEIGFMRRLHLREGLEDMKEFRDAVGVLKDRVQDGYARGCIWGWSCQEGRESEEGETGMEEIESGTARKGGYGGTAEGHSTVRRERLKNEDTQ
jgi:hypothetical protein